MPFDRASLALAACSVVNVTVSVFALPSHRSSISRESKHFFRDSVSTPRRNAGYSRTDMKTSDAGSQYCWGRVGRGILPPTTPHATPRPSSPPPHTHTYTRSIQNARLSTFRHVVTGGPMVKASYRVACPQVKMRNSKHLAVAKSARKMTTAGTNSCLWLLASLKLKWAGWMRRPLWL